MECSTETNNTTTTTTSSSPPLASQYSTSPSSSPPQTPNPNPNPNPPIVISPCAACKILRRRCADKCVLAPYFPPTEPAKFTIAHRVFGASNIIKFLQELPESQRADAVSSMVYEASARIRDPVYGCAGAICQLQKQVSELQAQLAKAQAEVVNMQCQQANLVAFLCMEVAQSQQGYNDSPPHHHHQQQSLDGPFNNITSPLMTSNQSNNSLSFLDDNNNLGSLWEPLWT
ncbi:Lateral organ boundaries domain containing protein [Trema orientale]|uniref:Lateral organ boundaries domain containing protein n=1 Tax=Trema orientale TaxID=63057 RepID=A0A2P5FF34_TREOI|nr:Lateral organ boundaries domain containing protein [Trema orientale]